MKTMLDIMLGQPAPAHGHVPKPHACSCGCAACREMEAGRQDADGELFTESNEEFEWREEEFFDEMEVMEFETSNGSDLTPIGDVEFAPLPPAGVKVFWPLISKDPKNKVITYRKTNREIRKYKARAFLDARSGYRHHMAVDLYAREGDEVIACEDGVIRSFYHFYRGVYALFVDHGRFVINYGEVAANSLKRCFGTSEEGTGTLNIPVKAGQRIAYVGKMYHSSMLHLETYRPGTVKNERWCWKKGGSCKRGDTVGLTPPPKILNPTKYLFHLKQYGQSASPGGTSNPTREMEWETQVRPRSRDHRSQRTPPVVRVPARPNAPRPPRRRSAAHVPPPPGPLLSGNTVYLPIQLGTADRGPVGVFIPPGFTPGSTADFLLYLHGWKTPCGMSSSATVKTYWQDQQFLLREKVLAAKKNVILVVPTLGSKSEAGWLTSSGGFDRFWQQVLAGLTQQKALPSGTGLGNIILSGHSGAGTPMLRILKATNSTVKNIKEVWVFDGFYFGKGSPAGLTAAWSNWARQNSSKVLYAHYEDKGKQPSIVSKALKATGLPNITALPTQFGHCQIPGKFMEERTKGAAFLKNLP